MVYRLLRSHLDPRRPLGPDGFLPVELATTVHQTLEDAIRSVLNAVMALESLGFSETGQVTDLVAITLIDARGIEVGLTVQPDPE